MPNWVARVQFEATSCGNLREIFGAGARYFVRNWTIPSQLSFRQSCIIIHYQTPVAQVTNPSDFVLRQFKI
jgi:hypothetical protein